MGIMTGLRFLKAIQDLLVFSSLQQNRSGSKQLQLPNKKDPLNEELDDRIARCFKPLPE